MTYPSAGTGGKLIFPKCVDCEIWLWPENPPICRNCGAEATAVSVEPHGRVRSMVTVHRGVRRHHLDDGPYILLLLDLDAGLEFITRLSPGLVVEYGDQVTLEWIEQGNGFEWPVASTVHS